jgi:hypothetical protein
MWRFSREVVKVVPLSKIRSNIAATLDKCRRVALAGLLLVLLLAGGWLYSRRVARVEMAAYVPESALGYVEVNDLPRLAGRLTSTDAWERLAPAYGLPESVRWAGWLGSAARWTGVGTREAVLLARAQFAVAVTGIEVRGEEVRPRVAFLIESHGDAQALKNVIAERLPQLATRAYSQPQQEATEYAGVPVTVYRSADGERRMLSAQMGSLWILANHPDPLRACVDTRQGRTPSMANNFYLKQARPTVEQAGAGELFAFVSGSGVSRLLQFGAHLVAGRALSSTPFSGLIEGLLADISGRALDGVAYNASFENGGVVDRYAVLFKPEVADALRAAVQVPEGAGEGRVLEVVPAAAGEVTVISVADLDLALMGIQSAVSSQIGAGQSFLLQRFVNSAREAFFGLKPGEQASSAVGGELAGFSFAAEQGRGGAEGAERVWLVAVRDRQLLARLAERYLSQRGAGLRRETYGGTELMVSADARRGAAAFVGDYLALGSRAALARLVDARQQGQSFGQSAQFSAASRPEVAGPSALRSFSNVEQETGRMMSALARRFGAGQKVQASEQQPLLDRLPLAASAASLTERGVYLEAHSPLGNFPLFVSLFDGGAASGEERAER